MNKHALFIFITDEDPSQAKFTGSICIVLSVGLDCVASEREQHTSLNAKSSMI